MAVRDLLSTNSARARQIRTTVGSLIRRVPGGRRLLQFRRDQRARRSDSAAHVAQRTAAALEERDRALAQRDRARLLQREHARLWAAERGDSAARGGPLSDFFADGGFSFAKFAGRRADVERDDNPYALGPKTLDRVRSVAGPVRFERRAPAGEPPPTVAFATVCTDKFVPGLEALVAGMLTLYPTMTSDVWVFYDDGLSGLNQQRLLDLYPHFRFADRDATKYEDAARGDSHNQQRIGALGYLTIEALLLDQYERVVLLDADLLVLDDISVLWSDLDRDDARVVPDAGTLPLTTTSELTGRLVFNSGVISLPASLLGSGSYEQALAMLPGMSDVDCVVLKDFADQKFWNIFLAAHNVTYLPTNFNANKQLIERFLPAHFGDAAIVHYTNAKPWFVWGSSQLVTDDERRRSRDDHRQYPVTFARWDETYRRAVGDRRRAAFRAAMSDHLDRLESSVSGGGAALIGNGPSLRRTDLAALDDRVRIAFNWFVNHDDFDEIRIDHLMVMSHMFFGGWQVAEPCFPDGYLDALTAHDHRPTLWFPYYFRSLIDATPELGGYDVRYLLLEKPFKQFTEQIGYLRTDLGDFLSDARTGVLTAGLPLALHLGCTDVVLVGCDASYGAQDGGDYFYAASRHTSASTNESTLQAAWQAGGAAHECYRAALRETDARGVAFADATIDGRLEAIPKREVPGLRREA